MIEDVAKSKVPALGYTVTYAVGNTLLTIWGLVIVLLHDAEFRYSSRNSKGERLWQSKTKKQSHLPRRAAGAAQAQPLRAEGQADRSWPPRREKESDAPDAQRRARQPELDLHHAARGLRHAAALRHRRIPARRRTIPTWAACRRRRASPSASRRSSSANSKRARRQAAPRRLRLRREDAEASTPTPSRTNWPRASSATCIPCPTGCCAARERIVHEFLVQEMCDGKPPPRQVRPLRRRGRHGGDVLHLRLADAERPAAAAATPSRSAVPTFTPYIEIAAPGPLPVQGGEHRRERGTAARTGSHTWQYADAEIDKLADKRIKAFFLVNPSNPPSYAMRAELDAAAREAGEDASGPISSSSPTTSTGRSCPASAR